MKKYHSGFVTLVLAGTVSAIALGITASIYSQRENVVVQETIVHGDKSVLDGVSVTQQTTMGNRLIWTTTTPLSDVGQAQTTLVQSRERLYPPSQQEGYVDVMYSLNQSGSTTGTFDFGLEPYLAGYPDGLLQDVASRVPDGETYTETVRVADYGAYYLPEIRLGFPGDQGYRYYFSEDDEENLLVDYFRQAVDPEDTVTVTMSSYGAGGIHEVDLDWHSDTILNDARMVAFYENSAYMATDSDQGVEIHCIDFAVSDAQGYDVTIADIGVVATLPDMQLFGEYLSLRGQQLFVLTGEERVDTITVLNLPEMDIAQTICVDGLDIWSVEHYDDFFVLREDGPFALYTQGGGYYTLALTGDFATYLDPESFYNYEIIMDYVDGKLVTAMQSMFYREGDSLVTQVVVNTPVGCVFTGIYSPSLNRDGTTEYAASLRNWDNASLVIDQ